MPAAITTDLVWREIEKHVFAVLSYVNPNGEARSAGMVYIVRDRKLHLATGVDSWKARHIKLNPNVALNVTIPKRIPFFPWVKVPHATIAFQGKAAIVGAASSHPDVITALTRGMVDDPEIAAQSCIIDIEPTGHFATYGIGVPLLHMRDPQKAFGRAPVH